MLAGSQSSADDSDQSKEAPDVSAPSSAHVPDADDDTRTPGDKPPKMPRRRRGKTRNPRPGQRGRAKRRKLAAGQEESAADYGAEPAGADPEEGPPGAA